MRETSGQDYFWIYIVAAVVFTAAAVYLMPKLIRFLDQSAARYAEKKVKRRGGDGDGEKKKNRYKTF